MLVINFFKKYFNNIFHVCYCGKLVGPLNSAYVVGPYVQVHTVHIG